MVTNKTEIIDNMYADIFINIKNNNLLLIQLSHKYKFGF